MRLKGVSYDAGRVMGFNWRPDFDMDTVRREMEIICNGLHCNAVRICGRDLKRLIPAASCALKQGLIVLLSPELWDQSPAKTLAYITKAATAAENLRQQWPDRIIFSVGSELTLFMQGIIAGKNITARTTKADFITNIKSGKHNKPLNEFLSSADSAVRADFHGQVTYASLIWEAVDWNLFDFVGVDHYRAASIEDKYLDMLKPSFLHNKPVIVTEFGYATCRDGIGSKGLLGSAGLGGGLIDLKSQFIHYALPVAGKFIRPRLNGKHGRDEDWQACKIVEQLSVLDRAGVDGAFIFQFVSQITPYNSDPRYDLDMAGTSLVKYYADGAKGETYPDLPWEPKASFKAVADYYASH